MPTYNGHVFTIAEARETIQADCVSLARQITTSVQLPAKHEWMRGKVGAELARQLTWFLGCEIRSSEGGVSLMAAPAAASSLAGQPIHIEVRYFHPAMRIRAGERKLLISRPHEESYGATVWFDTGLGADGRATTKHLNADSLDDLGCMVAACLNEQLRESDSGRSEVRHASGSIGGADGCCDPRHE